MKNKLSIPAMGIIFLALSSFNSNPEDLIHARYARDYVSTVCNETLFNRFEVQFSGIVKSVESVDVHFNEQIGYYYKVSGVSPKGVAVIEYFKTTKKEVNAGTYNYIELNKETTGLRPSGVCREDFDNLPNWCTRYNKGVICGRATTNGNCIYF